MDSGHHQSTSTVEKRQGIVERSRRLEQQMLARPFLWFLGLSSVCMAALFLVLQSVGLLGNLPWSAQTESLSATSEAMQAIIGNAVVGASAIVALIVAVAALRVARRNNELSDPVYALSQQAHESYRRYGFLMGSMLATFRGYQQESSALAFKNPGLAPSTANGRSWEILIETMQNTLLGTPFVVASLAAAQEADKQSGTGNAHVASLRRAHAFMTATLAASSRLEGDPNVVMTRVALASYLLNQEIDRGKKAVQDRREQVQMPGDDKSSDARLQQYLTEWMPALPSIETGEELWRNVRAVTFAGEEDFYQKYGPLPEPQTLFAEALRTFNDRTEGNSSQQLACDALLIAAFVGEHETLRQLCDTAEAFEGAKCVVMMASDPFKKPVGGELPVVVCSGNSLDRAMKLLEHLKCPRACIIIDGLRSRRIAELDALVEEQETAKAAINAAADREHADRFVLEADLQQAIAVRDHYANELKQPIDMEEYKQQLQENHDEAQNDVNELESEYAELNAKPKTRRVPPYSLTDFTRELWASDSTLNPPHILWVGLDYRMPGEDTGEKTGGVHLLFRKDGSTCSEMVLKVTGMGEA